MLGTLGQPVLAAAGFPAGSGRVHSARCVLPFAAILLFFPLQAATPEPDYYPPPDSQAGWRSGAIEGMDRKKLDEAFEYAKTTSQHGGLLVVRHGWLVYERYYGKGHRDANPDMASCGKAFTSISCGIMLKEKHDQIPNGLDEKVFTKKYLPEAFPLSDPAKAGIRLGHLLAMSSGMHENSAVAYAKGVKVQTAPTPLDRSLDIDQSALRTPLWCKPGEGYSYASGSPHIASIVLRHLVGMEIQQYIDEKLAKPMGFGRWGLHLHRRRDASPHSRRRQHRRAVHRRAAFRLPALAQRPLADQQLVPAEYVALCSRPSPYNPHYPFSLQFEVNADGHVAGAPRDAFWKSGAGGFGIYVIPSLDLVIYKMAGTNGSTIPRSPDCPSCINTMVRETAGRTPPKSTSMWASEGLRNWCRRLRSANQRTILAQQLVDHHAPRGGYVE